MTSNVFSELNKKPVLLGMSETQISALIGGYPKYTARQIIGFLYDGKDFCDMTSLKKELREELFNNFIANPVKIAEVKRGKSGAEKYLFRLCDDDYIEGVYMPHDYGNTLCLSTQIGCRMGCKFCASGLNGLIRNLDVSELLGQVVAVNAAHGGTAGKRALTNIVLMGSGEPFDNYDNVSGFLDKVCKEGLKISERNISLSTSGLADKIREFALSGHKITLSVSLHAPDDELRNTMMPINKKFSVAQVVSAARFYFEKTGRRVIFEYTLIGGVNDGDKQARELAKLVKGFPTHVNLIGLNEVKETDFKAPKANEIEAFSKKLEALGVSNSIRRSLGSDIEGACGQLRNKFVGQKER